MTAHPHIDPRELRHALGRFPTGVTIITTVGADGALVGLTVNSFNSLSLDPPLILWSLSSRSPSRATFESAAHFAVNILADDQAAISNRFASRVAHKFDGIALREGLGGVPLLEGCAAHIECSTHSSQTLGDHVLFVGRVAQVHAGKRPPLLFVGGRYHDVGAALD